MSKHDKKKSKDDDRSSARARANEPVSGGHHVAKAHGKPATVDASLPDTREALRERHAAARRRRASAELGSPEHRDAVDELGRIEIRIAAIERAMTPPRG
jgi:hypothetical protein